MVWAEYIEEGSASLSLALGAGDICVSNNFTVRFSMMSSSGCVTLGFVIF